MARKRATTRSSIDPRTIPPARLHSALADADAFVVSPEERFWFAAISAMPPRLRAVLLAELTAGNDLTTLDLGQWPHAGSVFASLGQRFRCDPAGLAPTLAFREVNDPHYWRAQISETVDGVEHLIVDRGP